MATQELNRADLENTLTYLRNRYKASKTEEDRAYYESKGLELKEKLDLIPVNQTIGQLAKIDRDELTGNLTLLILNLDKNLNINKGLTIDQIKDVSYTLCEYAKNLTLEDIALCLHQIKIGKRGKIYDRLDPIMLYNFIEDYQEEKIALRAKCSQNAHLRTKESGSTYNPKHSDLVDSISNDRASIQKERQLRKSDNAFRAYQQQYLRNNKKNNEL